MSVYVYLRVSSDKQETANQKAGIEEWCQKRGLDIDEYIDDTNKSGTLEPEKRQLGKLLDKLKKGDILVAGEISRLGRSLFMIMRILEHCMNTGVKVYTVKDGYELGDNITSKVLAFAFGLSAEIERNMISQRTKEALARKVNEGVILGRPKGRKTSETKHKLYQKDEIICELLICGISQRRVAKLLCVDRNTLANFMKKSEVIITNKKFFQKHRK